MKLARSLAYSHRKKLECRKLPIYKKEKTVIKTGVSGKQTSNTEVRLSIVVILQLIRNALTQ
jgi:hypothetical protein